MSSDIKPRSAKEANGLRITWADGTEAWFHNHWLRENCHCPRCTHQEAWERILDPLSIPLDIAPRSVSDGEQALALQWPEHDAPCEGTSYSWKWLREHRTEPDRPKTQDPRTAWKANGASLNLFEVDYQDIISCDTGLLALLERIEQYGVAVVVNMPTEDQSLFQLVERIAYIEGSHFGHDFQVVSKPDPENLAYTSHALLPHNDLPSRTRMPGMQLLHCICNDATGGESVLVDGLALANQFRELDEQAFDLLANTPVRFTSIDTDWDLVHRAPMFDVDAQGIVRGTRIHPALIGPIDVAPQNMDAFYKAYHSLLELCISDEMQFRFRLQAGMCQVFDNNRILHARKAFDPNSGERRLHGCYIPADDLFSKLKVLRRNGSDFRIR